MVIAYFTAGGHYDADFMYHMPQLGRMRCNESVMLIPPPIGMQFDPAWHAAFMEAI